MKPILNEKKHFESKANYYASLANGTVFKASVHLEDSVDLIFWKPLLHYIFPLEKFNFIYESESFLGNITRGCDQCLKYKDYLSKQFFICIDSDYRYLLQEAGISASNYIFQTYTYSIENHLCYTSKLNAIPEKCTGIVNTIFDFEAFLLAYSQAVYEAYIWHLYFLKTGDYVTFSKDMFIHILSLNGMSGFSIDHNGQAIINELTSRCIAKVTELNAAHPHVNFAAEESYFSTLGLIRNNAYLYVRGHNLFDLVVKIGNDVCNKLLELEKAHLSTGQEIAELYAKATPFQRELERVIVFEGYGEMEKIKDDIDSTL